MLVPYSFSILDHYFSSIQPEHASVTNKGGVVKIKCVGNSKVVINGQSVTKEQQLHHHDRVLFGSSHLYVFHSPQVS
mgnify:FL=1